MVGSRFASHGNSVAGARSAEASVSKAVAMNEECTRGETGVALPGVADKTSCRVARVVRVAMC